MRTAERDLGPEWTNELGMRFIRVDPQEFDFIAREHEDEHEPIRRRIRITRPFWISELEVSRQDFIRVVGRAPRHDLWRSTSKGTPSEDDEASAAPAVSVSHEEAAEFCTRLMERARVQGASVRYHLPTEAEWALFTAGHPRSFRFEYPMTELHWTVWEWCADFRDLAYYDTMPTTDPHGPPSGEGHVARVAWSHPDPFSAVWGFRVVVAIDESDSDR